MIRETGFPFFLLPEPMDQKTPDQRQQPAGQQKCGKILKITQQLYISEAGNAESDPDTDERQQKGHAENPERQIMQKKHSR